MLEQPTNGTTGQLFGSATATGQETAQGTSRRMREEGGPRRDYGRDVLSDGDVLNDCDS